MHASLGDRITIHSHRPGELDRDCEVLEARGAAGGPPFVVRWVASGHLSLYVPGPDATVEALEARAVLTR